MYIHFFLVFYTVNYFRLLVVLFFSKKYRDHLTQNAISPRFAAFVIKMIYFCFVFDFLYISDQSSNKKTKTGFTL